MAKALWTSQLAEAGGVTRAAVLFYERLGLLPKPTRKRSGYRMYRSDAVAALRFIVTAKQLGFTLAEIKVLLAVRADAGECAVVHPFVTAKIEETEAKIEELSETRRTLADIMRGTASDAPASEHPLFVSRD